MTIFKNLVCLLTLLVVAGCATASSDGPPLATQNDIAELTRQISALGPDVDPEEAARAARISLRYTHQLALEYQITDLPLIHNMKVNQGLRPRGLCWHWAEDLEIRLGQENFQTLDLHRAIANSEHLIRIDHSTTIVSQKGGALEDGLVLDPWRKGGILHWVRVTQDDRYEWVDREKVFARKRALSTARTLARAG